MQIAFVAQPIDLMTPPVRAGSVALWLDHVAHSLAARGLGTMVIGNNGARLRTKVMEQAQVRYVLTPTLMDAQVNRIGRRFAKWFSGGAPQRLSYVNAGWHHLPFGLLAARAAAASRADVVHVMNYSQLVPSARRRNPKATIALHMHCEWLSQFPREVLVPRLRDADLMIGCSQHVTRLVAERFPEYSGKCVTVPNATDVIPEQQLTAPSGRRIAFVGRLSPEKGIHHLIVAFRILLERFPDASLHLIGAPGSVPLEYLVGLSDDPDVQTLRSFYQRRNPDSAKDPYLNALEELAGPEVGRRIFFEGYVDRQTIQDHYRQATMLVNPSLSESFGVAVVEAMMMGRPVVATRVGGMQHTVVEDQTGLLVPPADPEALANAMGVVLADRELACRLGAAGRIRALQHFTWTRAVDQLLEAYATVPKQRLQ